jgi:spermidine synthase
MAPRAGPTASINAMIVVVFFLSGATALVYEVLWTRQLALVFGVTTYAVATVLATYMAGLALGSYLGGRWVDHARNPLAVYAALEAGIGLYALAVPVLFAAVQPAYVLLHRFDLSYPVFSFGRALLAGGVLLLPTTLMGGTFPVLTRFWVRSHRDVGRGVGVLYFINTAGAIAGCLLAGFVLIERLGLTGTMQLAAAANLALAAVATLLALRSPAPTPFSPREETAHDDPPVSALEARLVLFSAGLSGFVALAAEVLWARALLRYVYNSTYAFTTMLATFLAGIALGSALFSLLLARTRRAVLAFAGLLGGVGVGLAAATILFPQLRGLSSLLLGTDVLFSFRRAIVTMVLRAGFVLLPPTVFLGALLPLAITICAREPSALGRGVGRVYAVNTLGAICGSLAVPFVLIPTLGMQGTLTLLVAASLVASGTVAAVAVRGFGRRVAAGSVAGAVLAAILAALPADIFRRTFLPTPADLVYYREGATDTVGVSEHFGQRAIHYEDQRGTASTFSYGFNFFLGHLPMLLHPGTPRRVLHICFGVGNSLSAVAAHEELERVDNVELSPHVLEAGRYFWTNNDVLDNPKVRTIIDDGRNFLATTRDTYDVILLEPPETFTAGVINLYTTEFYRAALTRLAADGLMMQWVPTGLAPVEQERRLFRAFADVFPHATMWWQLNGGCALLIGTKEALRIDYQRLRTHMQEPRVARDLELSQVRDVDHLLSFFVFDEAGFGDFVRDVPPTTDDHTMLDFSMPRYLGSGYGFGQWNSFVRRGGVYPLLVSAERSRFYAQQRRSVLPYLINLGDEQRDAIAARIAERAEIKLSVRWYGESQWHRW